MPQHCYFTKSLCNDAKSGKEFWIHLESIKPTELKIMLKGKGGKALLSFKIQSESMMLSTMAHFHQDFGYL